jgi:hypothetical protein
MTPADLDALSAYRARLFAAIKAELKSGGDAKSSDGSVSVRMPGYFGDEWGLEVYCYCLGPGRHYAWDGPSLRACVAKANADLDKWIKETP